MDIGKTVEEGTREIEMPNLEPHKTPVPEQEKEVEREKEDA